jgi:hypothetical protein
MTYPFFILLVVKKTELVLSLPAARTPCLLDVPPAVVRLVVVLVALVERAIAEQVEGKSS